MVAMKSKAMKAILNQLGQVHFHANLFDEGQAHEGHQGQQGTVGQQIPAMYNMLVSDVVVLVFFLNCALPCMWLQRPSPSLP